jgi:hypothetical protein
MSRKAALQKGLQMRRSASFLLLAVAILAMGCSTAQQTKLAGDPIRPLCEFAGLAPGSPEWSHCMATMPTAPDRDLLVATIQARVQAEASGAPDTRAEIAKLQAPIFAESLRREKERRAQAARTGTADCGAWHWDAEKDSCQP